LCVGGQCLACNDPADDKNCTNAYGNGSPYLCLAGACSPGECRTTADCASLGKPKDLCGTSNFCGACDPLSGSTIIVDPVNGSDTTGTGSASFGKVANEACAFKTVTAAIAAIGSSNTTKYVISVVGPSTLDASEKYPLTLPADTTLTATGGTVVVNTPAGDTAVVLARPATAIDGGTGFDIKGGLHGIGVDTGSTDGTFIRDVTVEGTSGEGITLVHTGKLTIFENVLVTGAGDANVTASGIVATDTSILTITVKAGLSPTVITANSQEGIDVLGNATLLLTGVPDPSSLLSGTVMTTDNAGAGVQFEQTSPVMSTAAKSSIDGLVSTGSVQGSGILVSGGISLKVRNSVLLANGADGVHVVSSGNNSQIGNIDFGTSTLNTTDYGNNILQQTVAQGNQNAGAGICLDIPASMSALGGQTLSAEGNIFGTSKDCRVGGALLTNKTCTGAADASVKTGAAIDTNSIDFKKCGG
jgi:hypothetical protein